MIAFLGPVLSFFLSPIGRIVGIGLIVAAAYGAGVWKGHSIATGKCNAAALLSKIDAMNTDLDAATKAADEAEKARSDLAAISADDKLRIEEYETQLRKRPDAACTLGDDDIRWLRDGRPNRK